MFVAAAQIQDLFQNEREPLGHHKVSLQIQNCLFGCKNFSGNARKPQPIRTLSSHLSYAIGRGLSRDAIVVIAITEEFRKNALIRD